MTSAICTLFEGNYHYGVGALANSLYEHGYRGKIYAGYRGALPPWAAGVKTVDGVSEFSPAPGLTLRFIALTTTLHLTNHKPEFMLEVWNHQCPDAGALFYFDPDIVTFCSWQFFEGWVEAGVAVCQDVNPSMADNHPIRHAWRKLLQSRGLVFRQHFEDYYNAGFLGLSARDKPFLSDWIRVLGLIGECGADLNTMHSGNRCDPFTCRDQDGMNITCMTTEQKISPVGQDGMDFQRGGGGYIMSHAAGGSKPWRKPFLRNWLIRGTTPSIADKRFFKYCKFPIRLYSPQTLRFKRLQLLTAAFLGRFMGNS